MPGSEAVTHGIRVHVESRLVAERSRPAEGHWLFAYEVTLHNEGTQTLQLLSRHWIITDGNGKVEQVRGPGVVGKQPVLEPGQSFRYTSACPLGTAFGTMKGSYRMVNASNEQLEVEIAPFALSEPYGLN